MQSAAKIMRKKQFIREELERRVPDSDALWHTATRRLQAILRHYEDIPAGEHLHTDSFIFPAAAIYLTVKQAHGQELAYSVIENAATRNCKPMAEKLAKMCRIPGFPGLFVRMWDPITKRMFGEKAGFQNVFYPHKKGEYRMDIVACPYTKYFRALKCPELTRIFCENDVRIYGNLPGVAFIRHTTLGTGGTCCDFCIRTCPASK